MTTTVKLDDNGKTQLEKLQAKLRLKSDIKIDQFRSFDSHFKGLVSIAQ